MKLTSFYAAPVCTPSRAQMMTGCYAKRVSLPNVIFPACPIGLSAKEHTVAGLLKQQGYATMAIGKWHLGDQPEFLPTRRGFDHYLGLPYSNDMGGERRSAARATNRRRRCRWCAMTRSSRRPADQDTLTARYTDEAVKFITANKDRPFFLYLPHTAVHVPLHPGAGFKGKSANGTYGDWVEEVDWSVGRVLDTLRELKLAEHTLVLFTSDNGPWLTQGKNGGMAGPLRGGKGTTWEGGMREPTIAWWPGQIAAGTRLRRRHERDRCAAHVRQARRRRTCRPTARSTARTSGRCCRARPRSRRTRPFLLQRQSAGGRALRPVETGHRARKARAWPKAQPNRSNTPARAFTISTPTSAKRPTSPRSMPRSSSDSADS